MKRNSTLSSHCRSTSSRNSSSDKSVCPHKRSTWDGPNCDGPSKVKRVSFSEPALSNEAFDCEDGDNHAATDSSFNMCKKEMKHAKSKYYEENEEDDEDDDECETEEKRRKALKYPRSIFLIIATEFCERFSFCGLRSKSAAIEYRENIVDIHQHVQRSNGINMIFIYLWKLYNYIYDMCTCTQICVYIHTHIYSLVSMSC